MDDNSFRIDDDKVKIANRMLFQKCMICHKDISTRQGNTMYCKRCVKFPFLLKMSIWSEKARMKIIKGGI